MSQRTLSLGLLAAVTLVGTALPLVAASAADLDYNYGDAAQPVAETKVEFGSGWYIRGDIGATHSPSISAGSNTTYDTTPVGNVVTSGGPAAGCSATSASPNCQYNNAYQYNNSVFGGPTSGAPTLALGKSSQLGYNATIGGGYQFNHWFRVDGTFDFLKPVQSSYQGAALPCITATSPLSSGALTPNTSENILAASCSPTFAASLKSYAALVNGYVDLGTWSRVTPYVGAGVGLSFGHAQTSVTYKQNNGVPYQVSYTDSLSGSSFYQNWNRNGSSQYYNLAFALMGGIAIDVYDHTKLDIGYRYLHLGEVLGSNITTQEVRAGLRYMVDN